MLCAEIDISIVLYQGIVSSQVLGIRHFDKAYLMNTRDLCTLNMKQMGVVDDTDTELYLRHLVLLVSYSHALQYYKSLMYDKNYSASLLGKWMKTAQSILLIFVSGSRLTSLKLVRKLGNNYWPKMNNIVIIKLKYQSVILMSIHLLIMLLNQ